MLDRCFFAGMSALGGAETFFVTGRFSLIGGDGAAGACVQQELEGAALEYSSKRCEPHRTLEIGTNSHCSDAGMTRPGGPGLFWEVTDEGLHASGTSGKLCRFPRLSCQTDSVRLRERLV
eukprot:4070810-Prymnesium_polylepis.1